MEVQRLAVSAGRLALPAFEIEQTLIDHGLEFTAERGVHPCEDPLGGPDEFGGIGKRPQRLGTVGIDGKVPRPQHLESQPSPARLEHSLNCGGHCPLDRLVEALAVGGGVVEAELCRKDVVPEVGKAGVPRRPHPELIHLVEESAQLIAAIQIRPRRGAEGPLPHGPVRALEEGLQLGERPLYAVPLHSDRAGDSLIARAVLLQLREYRNVFIPKDLDLGAESG